MTTSLPDSPSDAAPAAPTSRPRSLLRRRDVALVWGAGLVSWIGIYVMFVVLPFHVYDQSGSALATAVTVLASALPSVLLSQVAGVVADRVDRRRLLAGTTLVLALLSCGYLAVLDGPWWQTALLNLVLSCVGQLVGPAEHALLPELVEAERLGEAAGLNALNNNLARLVGPALGGVLAGALGMSAAVLANALTYLLASVLVALVSRERPHTPAVESEPAGAAWRAGLAVVLGSSRLRALVGLVALTALGEGFLSALMAPLVKDLIGGDSAALGWILSAQAVGGLVGAWWVTRVADARDPLRLLGGSAVAAALLLVVIFNYGLLYPRVWPSIVLTALAGVPFAVFSSAAFLGLQLWSPPAQRGRVFGLHMGAFGLAQLLGITLAGLLADRVGVLLINADALAYLLAGVVLLVLSRRLPAGSPAQTPSAA